uniref:Uncharacterized protein n=1 Tax=Anguilla anguilla TaxID=7936 RepID=A0A0E9R7T5_ANGAN
MFIVVQVSDLISNKRFRYPIAIHYKHTGDIKKIAYCML